MAARRSASTAPASRPASSARCCGADRAAGAGGCSGARRSRPSPDRADHGVHSLVEEIAVLRHAGRIGLALPARDVERLVGEDLAAVRRQRVERGAEPLAHRDVGRVVAGAEIGVDQRRDGAELLAPRAGIDSRASPRNSRSSGGMQSGWAATLRSKT